MSPLALIPDAEQVIGGYLREHASLIALQANVAGRTPSALAKPWVRLTQLDGQNAPGSSAEHLIGYLLQLDCYAGDEAMRDFAGQMQAWLLARSVRAALHELMGATRSGAVVAQVSFAGMARIPDSDFEPARERVILTATVRMHAA